MSRRIRCLPVVGKSVQLATYFAAGSALALTSASALADPSPALDRFSLSAGAYYVDPTFRVNANSQYGSYQSGDIDRDRTALPRVRAELLLFDSQGLSFDYFTYKKNYGGAINRTIPVGTGSTLNANGDANIQVDMASLAYKWWIGQGNDVFGIGLGAGYYRAKIDVNASATLNGAAGTFSDSYSEKTWAPLLELGWKHAFSKDFRIYAEASGVKKNWGKVTGHIYGAAVGAEWYPLANLGIGADYGITRIKINRDGGGAINDANLDIRLKGPSAYVKVRF